MRSPGFLIVGAMKAGTTSLFEWLGCHPSVALSAEKEPNFFLDSGRRVSGWAAYEELFAHAGSGQITGEASVTYSDPRHSRGVAARIAEDAPDARLIFLTRDPVDRMRSHYLHEVKRDREHRRFLEAIRDEVSTYQLRSRYLTCLRPFMELHANQLIVVPMETVFGQEHDGWFRILRFLGLEPIDPPNTRANVTMEKAQFRAATRVAWDLGVHHLPSWTPRVVRASAKRLFLSDGHRQADLVASADDDVPHDVRDLLEDELSELQPILSLRVASPRQREESV